MERDFTKDFMRWRCRACAGAAGVDADSLDSTSLDKDLTRLKKGLEEGAAAATTVDLEWEEEIAEGRSEGQEELAGGSEARWE